MNNIINFAEKRKQFLTSEIYVGDLVEWQDYSGENYEGRVTRIEHLPLEGHGFNQSVECLPLWEKDEYVVYLGEGFSIIGECVVRKIIRRAGTKGQALPRFGHAN